MTDNGSLTNSEVKADFYSLGSDFFSELSPTGLLKPEWVAISPSTSKLLGLDPQAIRDQDLDLLSGHKVLGGTHPLSMIYSGHQFGAYNPQLGDGRGILLGEISNPNNDLYDIHLKGAGSTPYSRMGDGKAVLRSSVREFLCSEAMSGLGVPTTRALALVRGHDQVVRERIEPSAMVSRIAKTHIRFGSFEFFSYTNQTEQLQSLLDYTILRYFPLLQPDDDGYLAFFQAVLERTAKMVAKWQAVGFCHGVMNTDNMSILGETFDYGPFGFMESYNPGHICNHSDHSGRYAFNQQPNISYWNVACLGQALLPLINEDVIKSKINAYPKLFGSAYLTEMRSKLGLLEEQEQDASLVQDLLEVLHQEALDYTNFFRTLSAVDFEQVAALTKQPSKALSLWLARYKQRLEAEQYCPQLRAANTRRVNPKFILRNYLAQQAIDSAEVGDYSEVSKLMNILETPYEEHPEYESYAQDTPDWGCGLQVSCSS